MLPRESTIRRDGDGRWFHEGVEITRPSIARAFDRWIDRAEDGRYILKNAINWVYVEVEGAPIFVRRLELDGVVLLHLSDDSRETLDARSLRQDPSGVLYCQVRRGTMPASFTRRAQLELSPLVSEDEHGVYLLVDGERVRPPIAADPLGAHP
jgi:hypothetical protein